MRLAWCTPFAPRSAIGRFSSLVVPELRRRHGWDVDIWYPAGAGGRAEPDEGHELRSGTEEALADYDSIVYNIGDHAPYHRRLVELSGRYAGVLILHDLSLTHLMLGGLIAMRRRDVTRELRRWYGGEAERVTDEMLADPGGWAWQTESVTKFPLTELAVEAAAGVVTHSEFAATDLRRRYAGDIWTLPLPALHYDANELAEVELPMLDDRQVILQAGVLNRNKCVSAVLDGFAAADISDSAQLVICGYAERKDLQELQRDVRRLGVGDSVHVLGSVTDAQLHSLRRRAGIATVLRDPCIEAASAVLLDSMAYGLAVVTVSSGHYLEVPDDAVVRVPVPPAGADLAEALDGLVRDPARTAALGAAARGWVETRHNPTVYAAGIDRALREAGAFTRRRQLAAELARTLRRAGFGEEDEVAVTLADTATDLFAGQPRRGIDILFD